GTGRGRRRRERRAACRPSGASLSPDPFGFPPVASSPVITGVGAWISGRATRPGLQWIERTGPQGPRRSLLGRGHHLVDALEVLEIGELDHDLAPLGTHVDLHAGIELVREQAL